MLTDVVGLSEINWCRRRWRPSLTCPRYSTMSRSDCHLSTTSLLKKCCVHSRGQSCCFGHRGIFRVDVSAIRSLLFRLAEIAIDLDLSVVTIDLNPLVVSPPDQGLEVLDVLVEIGS